VHDEHEKIDAALRRLTIHGGGIAELVDRWTRRAAEFQFTSLEWRRVPSQGGEQGPWIAAHGANHFRVTEVEGAASIQYVREGLGEQRLGTGTGTVAAMMSLAEYVVQRGGPFGSPTPTAELARAIEELKPGGRVWSRHRELRLEQIRPGLYLLLQIRPTGSFGFRLLSDLAQVATEAARLDGSEPVVLAVREKRLTWAFTDCFPLFGTIGTAPKAFLMCALEDDALGVLLVADGSVIGARVVTPAQLFGHVDFFLGAVATAVAAPAPAPATPVSTAAPSATPVEHAAATGTAPEPSPSVSLSETPGERRPTPETAPEAAAMATPATPGEKADPAMSTRSQGGSRRRSPSRRLPSRPLDELIARHLAHVAARIPGDVVGAATARAIWTAIGKAHRLDHAAISGRGVEVLRELHAAGMLEHMPADHAGRAALQILGALSPIVRRVHHRRWALMLPELRQENSDVVQAIRALEVS